MNMTGLSNSEIAKLLGIAPANVERAVKEKLTECEAKLREKLGQTMPNLRYPQPVVVFDLRGTTAGMAWGSNKIQLNNDLLLSEYQEEMLNVTLPHEYAHNFVSANWPGAKPHGREWKWVMAMLGLRPDVTHNMPVKKLRKHPRNHGYRCVHKVHYVTSHRHTKMQNRGIDYILPCGCIIGSENYIGEK